MAVKKKKESNFGLIALFLLLVGSILFVHSYYKNSNKKTDEKPVEEKKVEHSEEEINGLISPFILSFEQDISLKNIISTFDNGLVNTSLPEELKIIYAIKAIGNTEIKHEVNYKQKTIGNGYVCDGKYIKSSDLDNKYEQIVGFTKIKHKTVTTLNTTYYYNETNGGKYFICKKQTPETIKKYTHITSEWDDKNIYIYQYSAYTRIQEEPNTSYTNHNNMLPINITEKNITENLDIIDKYKYTFSYNENSKKYLLSKIEYIKTN